MKKLIWLFCLPFLFAGCKKMETAKVTTTTKAVSTVDSTYTSDHQYNLNVVYFVPTNNPALPDYERRLSDILLKGQKFYGDNMQTNGYGYKTFGLLTNSTKDHIKITLLNF